MSFYGGRTGQHFYIAATYANETAMNKDANNILANQFVLVFNNVGNSTVWIKSNNEFKKVGQIGAFYPTINADGNWQIGDGMPLGKATPDQLYLRVPYDIESEKYSSNTLEYAYGVSGNENNQDYLNGLNWLPLVNFEGLTELATHREKAEQALSEIQEIMTEIKADDEEVVFLSQVAKSYVDGSGVFDENIKVPDGYQELEINRSEQQITDNAKYYADSAQASLGILDKAVQDVETAKEVILNNLASGESIEYLDIKTELDLAARRDGKLGTAQEAYFLTDRLDNFLYQFDTYAEMRKCRQLRPGDTCTTLGVSRLGDSNSILFRVYDPITDAETGETLEDRLKKDLTWDEESQKYYINLPGGSKMASEKLNLDNGFVAYSVAMFSGLGSGGGGAGGTSAGSLNVSFEKTSVELPDKNNTGYEISYTWYGTVSGDGKLYVKDNLDGTIVNGATVPEGNQSFIWKPKTKGKHTLSIYVRDRMSQNTNIVILNIDVGSLELFARSSSGHRYSAGQQVNIEYEANALENGPVTFVGGLYKNNVLIETVNKVSDKNTKIHTVTFQFLNLRDIGQYSLKVRAEAGPLSSAEVEINFLIIAAGELSIIEMYDETQEHHAGKYIRIDYQAYYKNTTSSKFNAFFYICGGEIPAENCTEMIQEKKYWLISTNEIEPNKDVYFTLQGDFLKQSNNPYELMIKVQDPSSNKVAYLSTPLTIKIIEEAEEKYPRVEEWGCSSLVHYFDARQGQQNSDSDKLIWKNIAKKYNSKGGASNIELESSSFNWDTNGWNVTLNDTLHEGLRFDGNAYAEFSLGSDNIFDDTFLTDITRGATVDIYFKPYYTGVDTRLFECAFSNDLLTGLIITETQASMSSSTSSTKNDISVEFTPNQPTHITFVYEPIGTTETLDEKGNLIKEGFMKIYLNGVCCAAKTIVSNFKPAMSYPMRFNRSYNIEQTETSVGEQEIYTFRTFNRSLTAEQVLALYIKDLPESERKDAYEKNFGVEDENGNKSLPFTLPEVHFYLYGQDMSGMNKDDANRIKVTLCKHGKEEPESEEWDFCEVTWQGTSSIAYPVKNYKVKLRKKISETEDKKIKYQLYHGLEKSETTNKPLYPRGKKESTFTMKADYMDSSHCHNTGNANFVNDTGIMTNYALTPAQVRDLDRNLNEEQTPFYQNNSYYKDLGNGSYRPYKMSDHLTRGGTAADLEIRNSIYGFPCRLYIHKGTQDENGEWSWGGENYAGIYNFNHDKGCTDTFGLYRTDTLEDENGNEYEAPIFPHCTSFEISANSNTTAGAFKTRHFVKIPTYDEKGNEIEVKYGVTNINTIYKVETNKDGEISASIIYKLDQTEEERKANYCEVYYCNEDGSNVSTERSFILQRNLIRIDAPDTEAYRSYLRSYYEASFELRFPDDKQYRWKKDPNNTEEYLLTEEYYTEYESIKALIDWVDNATDEEFANDFDKHFDLDSTLSYFVFIMATGLIDNFGKNLMLNTWGLNKEGRIPYVYENNIAALRYFNFDANAYVYGYSDLNNLVNGKIKIYNDKSLSSLITNQYGIDENGEYDYSKLNLRIYEDENDNLIRTWEQVVDISNIIWYPHPYDLDSCLGSDNSGYLRYGTDIEMLPIGGNQGYNDFYTKTWNYQKTPFNTAASSLWYKFQRIYSSEIAERYKALRRDKTLHPDTFKEYYYNQEIGQMTKMDFNNDGIAKYLSDEAANAVVDGESKMVYPSAYAVINRGDDWGRLAMWIEKRLNFLDSLYEYDLKNSVVEVRAQSSLSYDLKITTHDPQYVVVNWTNEADSGDSTYNQIVSSYDNSDATIYYLAYTYKNGFEEYGISDKKMYSLQNNVYVLDAENGSYCCFYKASNASPYWELNESNKPQILGYFSPAEWYFDLKRPKNFEKIKIGKQFKVNDKGILKLADDIGAFSKPGGGSTDDQEVQIFGAYNLKSIEGLSSLKPTKLIMKAASKLLSLTCESQNLAEIDISNANMLRNINLHGCSNLISLAAKNARRLEKLDLSLSGVSELMLPDDGGNLQELKLGPKMESIDIKKQRQLSKVVLQTDMINQQGGDSIGAFLSASKMIKSISLEDCPNLSFDFEIITQSFDGVSYIQKEKKIDQTSKEFEAFVNDYGIFSLFNKLETLSLDNSYIYSESINERGIGKEFRLSILATSMEDAGTDGTYRIDYGPLNQLLINIPVEKVIFNNRNSAKGIVWPGKGISAVSSSDDPMEDRANSFRLGGSVKEIAVIGSGVTYMPCVNYWGNMPGLQKVSIEGTIKNKESRLRQYDESTKTGTERNALIIVLPDQVDIGENKKDQIFKEFTLKTANGTTFNNVDITSIISTSALKNYDFPYASGKAWVNDNYKMVDLSEFTANKIKINFSQLKNITAIKGFENINIGADEEQLNTFAYLFSNCNNLTSIVDSQNNDYEVLQAEHIDKNLYNYDTPSMNYMFYKCYKLPAKYIAPLFARNANTHLEEAQYMVSECHQLKNIELNWVNAIRLKSLRSFAQNCEDLEAFSANMTVGDKLTDLSYLTYFPYSTDTVSAKSKLKTFSLNLKSTSDSTENSAMAYVENMSNMLFNASALESLDMSSWNLNKISNMSLMCKYCSNLEKVIAPNGNKMMGDGHAYTFEYLQNLTEAFSNCGKLKTFLADEENAQGLYVWKFKDGLEADLTSLLYNGQSLGNTGLWAILQWPMLNVVKLDSMLSNSRGPNNLDLSNWNLSTVKSASNLFYSYNSAVATPGILTHNGNYKLDSAFENATSMFASSGFSVIDTGIITPNAKLKNINTIFKSSKVTDLKDGYKNWNVSNVSDFTEVFAGIGVTNLDLDKWNFDKGYSFKGMLSGMTKLIALGKNGIKHLITENNASQTFTISHFFQNCEVLPESFIQGFSKWKIKNKVSSLECLFAGCKNLTTTNGLFNNFIDAAGPAVNIKSLFSGATGLTHVSLPKMTIVDQGIASAFEGSFNPNNNDALKPNTLDLSQVDLSLLAGASFDKTFNNCKALVFKFKEKTIKTSVNFSTLNHTGFTYGDDILNPSRKAGAMANFFRGGQYDVNGKLVFQTNSLLYGLADKPTTRLAGAITINETMETYIKTYENTNSTDFFKYITSNPNDGWGVTIE